MPSATANKRSSTSTVSWLFWRRRPTSVADPARRVVTASPRHLEHGAPDAEAVAGAQHERPADLLLAAGALAADVGAVGGAEVFDVELVVAPEEAGVQLRRVAVVDAYLAAGGAPDRHLVRQRVGLTAVLGW